MTEDMNSSDERNQGSHWQQQSTQPWQILALRLAEDCQRQFEEPVADLDGMEQRGIKALKKLTKSYSDYGTVLTH